jgi:hypothetical protein
MPTGLARYLVDPRINRGACKLARTPRIIKKKKKHLIFYYFSFPFSMQTKSLLISPPLITFLLIQSKEIKNIPTLTSTLN